MDRIPPFPIPWRNIIIDPKVLYNSDEFWQHLVSCENSTAESLSSLWITLYKFDHQNRNRKLWFPCKYFSLNAASLTVIAVAVKLPMDLTNLMPGYVDQAAKLGSLGFMCTMMANILPSLATMDSKELVTNIIALGVLVITLVVNVCIQINTGSLTYHVDETGSFLAFDNAFVTAQGFIPIAYVGVLLMLLMIYACSSLAILKSKQILESKYQAAHQEMEEPQRLTVEKLKQHVRNYWIMAGTGSPQFMTACSATTSASGVICALSTVLHIHILLSNIRSLRDYKSDYKWSMVVILIIQIIGTILGTIAPLARCFATLSYKLSIKWIWNHIKVSKVESYWTQKLSEWKQSNIPFPSSSRKCKIFIQNLKILILSSCIEFQKAVVVACKMIAVIPILSVICTLYCFHRWKWVRAMFSDSGTIVEMVIPDPPQLGKDKDLSRYVLQLQDDMEFAGRTLKSISKSLNCLIRKAKKQQPNNLMKLLTGSTSFPGVEKFDCVPALLSEEYLGCWSLPLVILTTIAMSLPNIQNNMLDCLLSSVSEGLVYVTLVEESLRSVTSDQVSIQTEAKTLWLEIEVYHKWLGNKLPKRAPQGCTSTAGQILQLLMDTAKNMVTDQVESMDIGNRNDNSKCNYISAKSMYSITETILLSYHADINQVSQEELFEKLSSMITNILASCLINLPQVIVMKCHTSAIEKREASVHAATQLLGETMRIINTLQDRQLQRLNLDKLPYIEKWPCLFKASFFFKNHSILQVTT
ncbi:uncharacterized protein LOC111886902 isoform X1 [Lactuca sativa]|uniref:uncharacterized protein LOC111886902 isoform X1 n=1 Tax=Lactuca sativa TaxID=4236 RepID=UPI001C68A8BD|nr:uncharacterized protein LOC111886902 isoform X1 [Lactuca sativa]